MVYLMAQIRVDTTVEITLFQFHSLQMNPLVCLKDYVDCL